MIRFLRRAIGRADEALMSHFIVRVSPNHVPLYGVLSKWRIALDSIVDRGTLLGGVHRLDVARYPANVRLPKFENTGQSSAHRSILR